MLKRDSIKINRSNKQIKTNCTCSTPLFFKLAKKNKFACAARFFVFFCRCFAQLQRCFVQKFSSYKISLFCFQSLALALSLICYPRECKHQK